MTAAEEEGKGPAIGIDLGTSNARVGVWQHGRVEIIPDVAGSRATPSYVAFTDTHLLIGQIAKDLGDTQTLFGTKRLLGMNFSDPSIKSDINLWPFKVVAGPNDKPMISIHRPDGDEKQISAKQISTIIIGELRRIAEQFLKCTVKNAVITVPAYFNTLQRQAVRDAGAMAGLNVLRIINDPSAAAIAYAFNNKVTGNVLVFDLGGGCFDVSILTIDDSGSCSCSIEVKANAGDLHLGGEDFDNRMFSYLVEELKNTHGIRLHPTDIFGLKTTCERAKKFFSAVEAKAFEFQTFYEGKVYGTAITRSKYEELNMHFFKRCMSMVQKCLWDAKMDKRSIDHVILVGGSTKIPLVEKLLCEFFNRKDLLKVIDPEEAVTYGASILAAILCQRHETARDLRLLELTTTSVGLRRSGSFMDVVVPRSTPIPTKKSVDGRTKQRAIDISVYEGEESRIKFCKFLGKSEFCGFKHDSRLSLNFEIDADGILSLSAEHQTSGMQHMLVLHKSGMHYQGGDRKNHTVNVGAGMLTRKLSAATALTISYVAASLHNQGVCPYVRLDKEKIGCGDEPVSPT